MAILLGITGHFESGKTILAKRLQEDFDFDAYSFSEVIVNRLLHDGFAGRDENALSQEQWDWIQSKPLHELQKLFTVRPLGKMARQILQDFGQAKFKEDPYYWIKLMRINPDFHAVVDNVRRQEEAIWIKALGGTLIRLHRSIPRDGDLLAHPTEQSISSLPAIDIPEGTPDEVYKNVCKLLQIGEFSPCAQAPAL
jgi:hypothetical protein